MKKMIGVVIVAMALLVGLVTYEQYRAPESAVNSMLVPAATATSSMSTSDTDASLADAMEGVRSIDGYAEVVIASTTYRVGVIEGDTVFGALQDLVSEGKITLTGRTYPGLGYFIDSINGVQNGAGKYWVYYQNGVSATEGASMTALHPGDRVEWKFEKSR